MHGYEHWHDGFLPHWHIGPFWFWILFVGVPLGIILYLRQARPKGKGKSLPILFTILFLVFFSLIVRDCSHGPEKYEEFHPNSQQGERNG
jgi:hypothetical protein